MLPHGQGNCRLIKGYLDADLASGLLEALRKTVIWHQPVVTMFGRKIFSPRLAAWYGDEAAIYSYSGIEYKPLQWLAELQAVKQQLEFTHHLTFNSVLVNRYRSGDDGMGWHADDEPELGLDPVIASISLGDTRRFLLKHKTDRGLPTVKLQLTHGSLLIMKGKTQSFWKHAVPKTKKSCGERINLTYRLIAG